MPEPPEDHAMSSKKQKSVQKSTSPHNAFHQPFRAVAMDLKAQMKREEADRAAAASQEKSRAAKTVTNRPAGANAPSSQSEEALFWEAMAGVKPLAHDARGHAPPPEPRSAKIVSAEAEALAQLVDLVAGEGPFDMSCTEEFIEGRAPGVDRRVLIALKRGDYALQGHLDLHGLTRAEAKPRVEAFLDESRRLSRRCVLLIHGRGLNSKDQIPVLKESLRAWLCQGRIGKAVLAFCTARPCDGGAGAVYLLLRR